MNDFRNKQPNKRSGPASSIDGFSQPRKKFSQSAAGSSKNNSLGQLDNFKGSDGFTPRDRQRNVQAARPEKSSLDEPLLITKEKPPQYKRGFFGLGRKKSQDSKTKKPWSRKRKILTGLGIFFTIILMIVGFLVLTGYLNLNKILGGGGGAAALEKNVDPSKLKGEGDGRINILMLGKGGDGHEGADLTDTIILASVDPIQKEASLVSIPRDLYVPVTGQGSMKINAVYATGVSAANNKTRNKKTNETRKQAEEAGYTLLEQTIEKNFGVPVHYHATVDFKGFQQAIDTVGGVDLNVPTAVRENMRIDGKTYKLDVKPGQQHMDGFKALAYSRSRYTSARGDFDRSERQRLIIIAFKDKVMSAGTYSNPAKISGLLNNLGNHVQTNFSAQDLSRLYEIGKDIKGDKMKSIGLADPPNNFITTSMVGGQSVVVPRTGVGDFKEIQSYMRNALKDSFIRKENASIAVLNGTTSPGLASTKAEELKSYGYNITAVANAPTKAYPKTVIVDLRSGSKRYTKNYLEKRFGVSAVATIPDATIQPGTADFVIILGSDQAR